MGGSEDGERGCNCTEEGRGSTDFKPPFEMVIIEASFFPASSDRKYMQQ